MQGRAYLDLAREIIRGGTEVHWRGASGRAYYALMLECRDALFRWGFSLPSREALHRFVRTRFGNPVDPDLNQIAVALTHLGNLRNRADYDLGVVSSFRSSGPAQAAIRDAESALARLDALDSNPARRNLAVAAVRAAFP